MLLTVIASAGVAGPRPRHASDDTVLISAAMRAVLTETDPGMPPGWADGAHAAITAMMTIQGKRFITASDTRRSRILLNTTVANMTPDSGVPRMPVVRIEHADPDFERWQRAYASGVEDLE